MGAAFAPPGWTPPAPNLWEKPSPGTGEKFQVIEGVKEKWTGIDDSYVLRCSILVNRPDGWVEFPLWLNTGAEEMPDFAVVESIHIEWGPGISGSISIQTKMDYEMGTWFLGNEVSRLVNLLVVQMGYPKANVWTPIYYGFIDVIQPSQDPMGYAITLTARLRGRRMHQLRFDMSKYIVNRQTRRDVIVDFLKDQGYDVYFYQDPVTGRQEDNEWLDTAVETDLLMSGRFWPEEHTIEGLVYWISLEAGMRCIMWPHPETGHIYALSFINKKTIYAEEVKKELVLFSGFKVEDNVYPLLGFQCDNPNVYADRWMLGGTSDDVDPLTKKEVHHEVNEDTTEIPAAEEESEAVRPGETDAASSGQTQEGEQAELEELALEALESSGRVDLFAPTPDVITPYERGKDVAPGGVHVAAPTGRDETEKGRMQSYYDDKYTKGQGISVNLNTVGMPDAYPEMRVRVSRVGTRFDGIYHVHKVVHDVSGLWNTILEGVKHEFGKGAGLLKTSRPLLPPEQITAAFPAFPAQPDTDEAAQLPDDNQPPAGEETL